MSGSDQANAILSQVGNSSGMSLPDIIKNIGGVESNQNALLQNTELNRKLQAAQAYSQALTGAMNPDGSVDIGKLNEAGKTNQALAYAMGALGYAGQDQSQNVSAQDFHQKFIQNSITRASLLANIGKGLEEAYPNGDIPPEAAAAALQQASGIAKDDPMLQDAVHGVASDVAGLSPTSIGRYFYNLSKSMQSVQEQVTAQAAGTKTIGLGSRAGVLAPSPATGNEQVVGALPITPSPDKLVDPQVVTNNDKSQTAVPLATVAGATPQGAAIINPPMTQIGQPGLNGPATTGGQVIVPGTAGTPMPGAVQQPQNTGSGGENKPPFNPADPAATKSLVSGGSGVQPPVENTAAGGNPSATGATPPSSSEVTGFQITPPALVLNQTQANADAAKTAITETAARIGNDNKALNIAQMAYNLSTQIATGPGTENLFKWETAIEKGSGGLISFDESTQKQLAGAQDPQVAIQILMKTLAMNVNQQYDSVGGQSNKIFDSLKDSNADVSKFPQVFASIKNIAYNNIEYDAAYNHFASTYTGHDFGADWDKYAKDNGLAPNSTSSWSKQNLPNGENLNEFVSTSDNPAVLAMKDYFQKNPDSAYRLGNMLVRYISVKGEPGVYTQVGLAGDKK